MLYTFLTIAQAAKDTGTTEGPPSWVGLMPIILLVVMMFFLFRSQKKQTDKRKEMINRVKAGDEVVTSGGIKGKITKVKEKSFMIQISDKVEVEIVQNGVGAVISVEEKSNE